jgi:hypothetical protein
MNRSYAKSWPTWMASGFDSMPLAVTKPERLVLGILALLLVLGLLGFWLL